MGHHRISMRKTGVLEWVDNQGDTYLLRINYSRIHEVWPAMVEMQSIGLQLRPEELKVPLLADIGWCPFQQGIKIIHPHYKSLCLCDPATLNL